TLSLNVNHRDMAQITLISVHLPLILSLMPFPLIVPFVFPPSSFTFLPFYFFPFPFYPFTFLPFYFFLIFAPPSPIDGEQTKTDE
ncbi:hypothetical protein, partial [Segatella baroniae]|uniref:hypothetical protein n=1 Tax=Segatella baroniae TaxID=305719 RepID=UPI0028EE223F